mgnify:CR=1 FL=1
MDSEQIYLRVIESAEQFGPGNPQEFKLLGSQLAKCKPKDIFSALMLVFSRSEVGANNFPKQELAGRLLDKMKLKTKFDLEATIRSVIPAYDPSVEQLPYHFASIHGKDAVVNQLLQIEIEETDERVLACLKTMKWWLGARDADETNT